MVAMMVGGLWVIVEPRRHGRGARSVGQRGRASARSASLAGGTPDASGRARSADSMERRLQRRDRTRRGATMEFGNVGWCRDPARLDPRLRAAGLEIAAVERGQIGCRAGAAIAGFLRAARQRAGACADRERAAAARSAARTARSVPRAAGQRAGAQLDQRLTARCCNVLCGGSEATNCRGPTAGEAEFRTGSGTCVARRGPAVHLGSACSGCCCCSASSRCACSARRSFSLLYPAARARRRCSPRRSATAAARCFGAGRRGCSARSSRSCSSRSCSASCWRC